MNMKTRYNLHFVTVVRLGYTSYLCSAARVLKNSVADYEDEDEDE